MNNLDYGACIHKCLSGTDLVNVLYMQIKFHSDQTAQVSYKQNNIYFSQIKHFKIGDKPLQQFLCF